MKCYLCNGYHALGESCSGESNSNFLSNLSKYEPPTFKFNLPKPDPISYEPPTLNFNLPKLDPIPYERPTVNFTFPRPEPISYEPPTIKFDLPKYDPPMPPPPSPIHDLNNNLIGFRDSLLNNIQPVNSMINGGLPLQIQGNFVRDTMGNLVGQMGPGNTMFPPPSFGPPDPDPGF